MKIVISNLIDIENPTNEIKAFVKEKLTFKNPEYDKRKRMGFYVYNMKKDIKLYDEYNNHLYVPIGFFDDLYKKHPMASDYVDCTVSVKANIKSNIKLRNYQELAVEPFIKNCCGIISIDVGLRQDTNSFRYYCKNWAKIFMVDTYRRFVESI